MKGDSPLLFVIGRQRTGTTVFRLMLVSGGAQDCAEIFNPRMGWDRNFFQHLGALAQRDPTWVHPSRHWEAFDAYLADLRAQTGGAPLAIDVKHDHFGWMPPYPGRTRPGMLDFIRQHAHGVFHILRRNRLRTAASLAVSEAVGVWKADARQAAAVQRNRARVRLKAQALTRAFAQHERQEERLAKLFAGDPRYVEIAYEAMFDDDGRWSPDVIGAVRRVGGLRGMTRRPETARLNPEPLADLIANLDEVAAALAPTPYAWMLDA